MLSERVARVARLAALTATACGLALVLTGCGGGDPEPTGATGGTTAVPTSATPEATDAADLVTAAYDAAVGASSVHYWGTVKEKGETYKVNFIVADGDGFGTAVTKEGKLLFRKVGNALYVRGSDAFYRKQAGAEVARMLRGKWMKLEGSADEAAEMNQMMGLEELLSGLKDTTSGFERVGETTVYGIAVVELKETGTDDRLYVAANGEPYPVLLKGTDGKVAFKDWNKKVTVKAPPASQVFSF